MKTILIRMKSARTRRLQVLAETVTMALFLCQVVGSLCVMVPSVMVTSLTIHDAHAEHHMVMADTRMCQDSVPSSSEPQGAPNASAHSLLECLHSAASVQPSAFSIHLIATAPPSASALPLYTRLSTFRI